jgi:hypothetical protein
MTRSAPEGTASAAKSAVAAVTACRAISACGGPAWPDTSNGNSSVEASSHRRRCSDSANRRAFSGPRIPRPLGSSPALAWPWVAPGTEPCSSVVAASARTTFRVLMGYPAIIESSGK